MKKDQFKQLNNISLQHQRNINNYRLAHRASHDTRTLEYSFWTHHNELYDR